MPKHLGLVDAGAVSAMAELNAEWMRRIRRAAPEAEEPNKVAEHSLGDFVGLLEAGKGPGYWSPHYGREGEQGGSAPRGSANDTAGLQKRKTGKPADLSDLSIEELEALEKASQRSANGDMVMAEICSRRGIDFTPVRVTKQDMDEAIASGEYIELWRGVDSVEYAERFRHGEPRWGKGCFGNGIYTSTSSYTAEDYTSKPELVNGKVVRTKGGLIRIAMPKSYRVAEHAAINKEFHAAVDVANYGEPEARFRFLIAKGDVGRFAASQGYDALMVRQEDMGADGDYYVLFNTKGLLVEE